MAELNEINKKVRACFGIVDLKFALHQIEKNKAKELKRFVKSAMLNIQDVTQLAYGFLASKKCSQEHIDKEMGKWNKYFGIN